MAVTRIALIDDDDDFRQTYAEVLRLWGYECFDFDDAREALTWLSACAADGSALPSLILFDLIMPNMNGWEFRAAQRERPALAEIPVAVVTADVRLPQENLACEMRSKLMPLAELKALLSRYAG